MEKKLGSVPLESSLTELVLKKKCGKVRRPPNAFMIFAREHRKLLAKQHPDVSNKNISTMLGNVWKSTSPSVKQNYYLKAKEIGALHKQRYPDYVYSPREARLQKMKKIKKKEMNKQMEDEDLTAIIHLQEHESNSKPEENKETSCAFSEWSVGNSVGVTSSSPGYVPNNPDFFSRQSPITVKDGTHTEPETQLPRQCSTLREDRREAASEIEPNLRESHPEGGYCWSPCPEECECCFTNRTDHPRYSPASPGFCNPTRRFSPPMRSSFCCTSPFPTSVPRSYGPLYHPYWNAPYYAARDFAFESELRAYPISLPYGGHAPYHPPFGYFERPIVPMRRSPSSQAVGQVGEYWDGYRPKASESDCIPRNGMPQHSYVERRDKGEKLPISQGCSSMHENASHLTSYERTDSRSKEPESKSSGNSPKMHEMTNSSSSLQKLDSTLADNRHENEYSLTGACYVQDVPINKTEKTAYPIDNFRPHYEGNNPRDFTKIKPVNNVAYCGNTGENGSVTSLRVTHPSSSKIGIADLTEKRESNRGVKLDERSSTLSNAGIYPWNCKQSSNQSVLEKERISNLRFDPGFDNPREAPLVHNTPLYIKSTNGISVEADSTLPGFVPPVNTGQSENVEDCYSQNLGCIMKENEINASMPVSQVKFNFKNKNLIASYDKTPGMKLGDSYFDIQTIKSVDYQQNNQSMEASTANSNSGIENTHLAKSGISCNVLGNPLMQADHIPFRPMRHEDSPALFSRQQDSKTMRQVSLPNFNAFVSVAKVKSGVEKMNVSAEMQHQQRKNDKNIGPFVSRIVKLEK